MERLRSHNVTLSAGRLTLRPMTEDDWDILMKWNTDPDVLYYAEGDDVTSRTLEETQAIYRGVSQRAFVFIAELDGVPIGECWLQRMNLERVRARHPGMDLRRVDLTIGEKRLWGQGWGTRMIGLLTRFGFEREGADAIFGCDVADYNLRSRRAFEKNGYVIDAEAPQPPGRKSKVNRDMILTREACMRPGGGAI
ncbi:MAG TPA: GNAT family N-acetyltransferase [Planctomycetota bacterium]|nr:GNAT family N-acetyltransferase [Planctomycetota bacterium]